MNTQLAKLAARSIVTHGGEVDRATMREFDAPSFDGDRQEADGLPPGALEMQRRLSDADAFVVSSTEYNASMPGGLKNAIDWVSRFRPQPFNDVLARTGPSRLNDDGVIADDALQSRFDVNIETS